MFACLSRCFSHMCGQTTTLQTSAMDHYPLFRAHPDALQLIIYFDEIEVCNPLGSHAGVHKLGKVAYSLYPCSTVIV